MAFAVTSGICCNNSVYFISSDKISVYYFQGIILSALFKWLSYIVADRTGTGDLSFTAQVVERLPIPNITQSNQNLAVEISNLSENLSENSRRLINLKSEFLRELNLEKIPQKLAEFENLEFDEFIKELAKAKKEKFC